MTWKLALWTIGTGYVMGVGALAWAVFGQHPAASLFVVGAALFIAGLALAAAASENEERDKAREILRASGRPKE